MIIDYVLIIALIAVIIINFMHFVIYKIKYIKDKIKTNKNKQNRRLKRKSKGKLTIIIFCIVSVILKPYRIIPFFIHHFAAFILGFIRNCVKFICFFHRKENRKDLRYVILTDVAVILFILSLHVIKDKDSIIKQANLISAIALLIFVGIMLVSAALFIVLISRWSIKKDILTNTSNSIVAVLILFILVFMVLSLFEKYKNSGIKNTAEIVLDIGLLVYIIIILLMVLKNTIDFGSIFLSATFGLAIYILTLFFITSAAGFYLTGRYPDHFQKDEISVIDNNSEDLVSYMVSYSYRGAKYLMSFPNSSDFKKNETGKENDQIPIDIYLIYVIGMLINIIVTAFFVSYAVSVYLMKISGDTKFKNLTEKKNFMNDYVTYIKEKYISYKNL